MHFIIFVGDTKMNLQVQVSSECDIQEDYPILNVTIHEVEEITVEALDTWEIIKNWVDVGSQG